MIQKRAFSVAEDGGYRLFILSSKPGKSVARPRQLYYFAIIVPEIFMRFIVRTLAVIGLLAIIVLVALGYGVSRVYTATHTQPPINSGTVLTLTVEGPVIEIAEPGTA